VAAGNRRDHNSPVATSSTPATTDRACTSRPTDLRSPTIPRPPYLRHYHPSGANPRQLTSEAPALHTV